MKTIYSMVIMGLAAGLALTSCSQEEEMASGEAPVTITINAPEGLTRAGEGTNVEILQYAVYNLTASGRSVVEKGELTSDIKFPMSLDLQLITGREYGILLWAGANDSPYDIVLESGTMTPNYSAMTANSETLDAFYSYETLTVNGNASLSVTMKRPFAMVNIGATSLPEEAQSFQSSITVKGVAESLNLFTGELSTATVDATFGEASVPTGLEYPVGGFQTLAYAYVLAPATAATYNLTYSYKTTGSDPVEATVENVSLQANYRTNIYGSLPEPESKRINKK